MAQLFTITAPIFLLIALGVAAARYGAVTPEFVRGLGHFVLNVAFPALVFNALAGQDLRQTFDLGYLVAYAAGSLAVFAAVLLLFRMVLNRPLEHAALATLGASSSNSGFIGFPVAMLALGAPSLTALPLTLLVETVLIIPLALGLAEAGTQGGRPWPTLVANSVLRVLRMPLVLAILAGLVFSLLGLRLPAVLATAVGMLAATSTACALFAVGGTIAGLKATALSSDICWIVLGKLVLHPLAVAAGLVIAGVPAGLFAAGVLFASAPMLTTYPLFGQRFGVEGLCAAALVAATVAGFVTMTVALSLTVGPGATTDRPSALAAPGG